MLPRPKDVLRPDPRCKCTLGVLGDATRTHQTQSTSSTAGAKVRTNRKVHSMLDMTVSTTGPHSPANWRWVRTVPSALPDRDHLVFHFGDRPFASGTHRGGAWYQAGAGLVLGYADGCIATVESEERAPSAESIAAAGAYAVEIALHSAAAA